jgi:uncharacterized protein YqjF (DUF2071 family)
MRWASLLFMHWPCPPETLRPLVPDGLELDTFEGQAWVGLIPFSMKIRHRCTPGIPTARDFLECNVRTYVVRDGGPGKTGLPGVWFFSLDAESRLAVWGARRFWHLNYQHSRMSLDSRDDGVIHYEVKRVRQPEVGMKCVWKPGDKKPLATSGDLAYFLTERYALYSCDLKTNRLRGRGRIWHEPWPLREAEVQELDENLIRGAGIELDTSQPPVAWHADAIDVEAWALERG